jgi:hypothetical protein
VHSRLTAVVSILFLLLVACGDDATSPPETVATSSSDSPRDDGSGSTVPAPGGAVTTSTSSERRVHEDPQGGYRLSYPAAWVDQRTPGVFHIQADTGVSGLGIFSVLVGPDLGESLDELAAQRIEGLLEFLRDGSVQGDVSTMLGGVPARSITVLGYTPGGTLVTWLLILAVHGGRAYSVTYSGSAGGFDHFMPDVLSMLESWEFTSDA